MILNVAVSKFRLYIRFDLHSRAKVQVYFFGSVGKILVIWTNSMSCFPLLFHLLKPYRRKCSWTQTVFTFVVGINNAYICVCTGLIDIYSDLFADSFVLTPFSGPLIGAVQCRSYQNCFSHAH